MPQIPSQQSCMKMEEEVRKSIISECLCILLVKVSLAPLKYNCKENKMDSTLPPIQYTIYFVWVSVTECIISNAMWFRKKKK